MQNRIQEIRKVLKISQGTFGAKIGLSQRAISGIENGLANLTDRNFDAICDAFNVNPEWLRHGVGEMFLPPSENKWLDDLAKRKGLSPEEKALIASIVELPAPARKAVIGWAEKLIAEVNRQNELETENPEEEELRQVEAQLAPLLKRHDELTKKIAAKKLLDEAG